MQVDEVLQTIRSLQGISSAGVQAEGKQIKEIHLLTNLKASLAVKAIRTAVYVKTGYLIDESTVFTVARARK